MICTKSLIKSVRPKGLDVNRIELIKNKLFLVGSPILNKGIKKSGKKIFSEFPLLFREQGSATRNAMERYIIEKNLPVFKKIELMSNEATKQAIVAGLGYSIMPLIGIKNELKNGDLEIINMKGLPITTHWNLIWLKAKNLSPVAEAFLEYIKKEKETIKNTVFEWYEKY
jgi:DNA-binding transcriptional LysR family regulator